MGYPFSCSDPVWLRCWACLSEVASVLAMGPYRLPEVIVDHPRLSGALWEGDWFVLQLADRDPALRHLLIQIWLAPAACRLNRAAVTQVIAESLPACFKMMSRGPRPEPRRENPSSDPWRRNTAFGNAVGMTAIGIVRFFDSGAAPQLRVWLTGATPSYGEPLLCFPPDALPWCDVDG